MPPANPSSIRPTIISEADLTLKDRAHEMVRGGFDSVLACGGCLQSLSEEFTSNRLRSNEFWGCNTNVNFSSADSSPVSSRCSVRVVHEMVSSFSPEQVELVRSMGFGGLLHMPLPKQINLRFSTWLMSRVDEFAQTLIISDRVRIRFDKHDVATVFGIPSAGKSILSNSCTESHTESELVTQVGGINTAQLRSIKAAQAIVYQSYDGPMSPLQQDEFKAAFVVVVMSTLFAPLAMKQLGKGRTKLTKVLYLDSIDLGVLSMPHNIFPRIHCFKADQLRSMIVAVTSISANGADIVDSRLIKLRSSFGICYQWATSQISRAGDLNDSGMSHLWDAVVLMTRILKIPVEAAGPLFVAASAVGIEALDNFCVLLRIMEPYVNGFSYQSSLNGNLLPNDRCPVRQPHRCSYSECCMHFSSINLKRKVPTDSNENSSSSKSQDVVSKRQYSCSYTDFPVFELQSERSPRSADAHDFDMRAINIMARFYLTLRPVRAARCPDLNLLPNSDGDGDAGCIQRNG